MAFGHPPARRRQYFAAAVVILCAVSLAVTLVHGLQLGLVDNGDAVRVLRGSRVAKPAASAWKPVPVAYPLDEDTGARGLPTSTGGWIVALTGRTTLWLGGNMLPTVVPVAVYCLLFCGGAGLWLRHPSTRTKIMTAAVLSTIVVNPFLVSYFNSYYEEAVGLALLPAWYYYAGRALFLGGPRHTWFVLTLALLYSKTNLLPFAFTWFATSVHRRRVSWQDVALVGLIMFVVARSDEHAVANRYNRLMNGLAYSMSAVSTWPATEFYERHSSAADWIDRSGAAALGLPAALTSKWGTSFWPDGQHLETDAALLVKDWGSLDGYCALLVRRPAALIAVVRESFLTSIRASYGLRYLAESAVLDDDLWWPWGRAMGFLGIIFPVMLGVFVWAAVTKRIGPAALALPIAVAPLFVVVGDGYYEFEKHLQPFVVGGIVALLPLVSGGVTRTRSSVEPL